LKPLILTLHKPQREKPTASYARKVKEAADQNRTGGDSKWQGVDTFLEYVKLLEGQGHYVYIGSSDAEEMKAVWKPCFAFWINIYHGFVSTTL